MISVNGVSIVRNSASDRSTEVNCSNRSSTDQRFPSTSVS